MANIPATNAMDLAADRSTQVDVLRSPALLERIIQTLGLVNQPDLVPRSRFAPAIAEISDFVAVQGQKLLAALHLGSGHPTAGACARGTGGGGQRRHLALPADACDGHRHRDEPSTRRVIRGRVAGIGLEGRQ